MKISALIGLAVGLALSAWLLASFGTDRILSLLAGLGVSGLGFVVAFHLVQLLFSALGWRVIAGRTRPRPALLEFIRLRWIREGVNDLLPVAHVGGEFAAASLLRRRGLRLIDATAGAVCDLTLEMVTQIVFTVLGLLALVALLGAADHIVGRVAAGILVATLAAGAFVAAQLFGTSGFFERALLRLARAAGLHLGRIRGLHEAIACRYSQPRRVAWGSFHHLVSWMLGAAEVCLILHLLGQHVTLAQGLVIESLGQALKAAGFVVPGALGVQEGGYVAICALFGLSPEIAISLSLVKRLREVVLGVPALATWRWTSRAQARAVPASA